MNLLQQFVQMEVRHGSVLVLLSFPSNNSAFINKLFCFSGVRSSCEILKWTEIPPVSSGWWETFDLRSFRSFRSFRSITCFNTASIDDWQVKLEEALGARENPMINEIQNDEKGDWAERSWIILIWYYWSTAKTEKLVHLKKLICQIFSQNILLHLMEEMLMSHCYSNYCF